MLNCHNSELPEDIYKCDITISLEYVEERGYITSYGINLYNINPSLAAIKGESCRIDCISEDLEKVIYLQELINETKLYPVHLMDVVEDWLSLSGDGIFISNIKNEKSF